VQILAEPLDLTFESSPRPDPDERGNDEDDNERNER
jgi:hypothetical protein